MYWRFGFHSTSSIDTLLEKPDVTVETLLEDDDLLQECKSQNARLVQYLQRPDVVRTLLGYVTGDIDVEPRSSFKYPYLAAEVLCSDIWSIVETCLEYGDELMTPFWDTVLGRSTDDLLGNPVMAARFTKINSVFLTKKPTEMLDFIKSVEHVVPKLLARIEIPAIVDLLFRIVKSDGQTEGAGAVDWLSSEGFIPLLINLLSPYERSEIHAAVSELLKDIISISCPAPGNVNISGGADDVAQEVSVSNKLVRELAAERCVVKLVAYMLGDPEDRQNVEGSSSATDIPTEKGIFALANDSRVNPLTSSNDPLEPSLVHSTPTDSEPEVKTPTGPPPALAASALIHGTSVVIELIRKNHSDYYEPVLFHTLRNRLIGIQQHQAQASASGAGLGPNPETEDRESLETALAALAEGVGIVHLGHLLNAVCDRLEEFQELLRQPRTSTAPLETTMGPVVPLTFERLRICELYAELYHTSNMALLNRLPGDGPDYDNEGRLLGGLKGLGELARVTASGPSDASHSDRDVEESELQAAKELPVSNSSTDASSISADEEILEEVLEEVPVHDDPLESGPSERTDNQICAVERETAPPADPFQDPDDIDEGAVRTPGLGIDLHTGQLCSGDRLKRRYLDLGVLETLLNLFFDFPWNNFLHLVVYDVVHQVLTGRVEEGYNRSLTVNLLQDARLIDRILEHQRSDGESLNHDRPQGGFRGHLMLLADDVIQAYDEFTDSMKASLDPVIPQPDWDSFVAQHRIAKEQEKQVLGGARPMGANRRSAPFTAQVDEVGPNTSRAPAVTLSAPPGSSSSLTAIELSSSRAVAAMEQDDRDAVLVTSPEDEDDDDEWGSFASTSQADAPLAFDESDESDGLAFTPAPSISERVLTIADLNSSFHADVEANGSTAAFEQWPPEVDETEDALGQPDALEGQQCPST
ncbi:SAPS-domain-containing protein [Calocera viscosa TUFC12733]|uniref:SAPS-domain-containing protein n=1 Tax=Calocera viscosa (strain TUFC12733) TaxID=1330018 RepID=A0A167RQF6_CALVF|nr:SAPS-domain-containing protein [Calocera viscosa TUFC12733]